MTKYGKEEIEKMEEYLRTKKDIFDFIINRSVLKSIVFYFGILSIVLSIVLLFGGKAYIDYKIKARIDKIMSEKIDEEYAYLSEQNKIAELGNLAVSTGKTQYYENLEKYLNSKKQKRIYIAAKAELMRIGSFFFALRDDECFSAKGLKYVSSDGKISEGYDIHTQGLIEIFSKTDHLGKKTTILQMLGDRCEKDIPEFLLKVALDTDTLRIRHVSLRELQRLINDFSVSQFNYEENKKLWEKHKDDFCKKAEKRK